MLATETFKTLGNIYPDHMKHGFKPKVHLKVRPNDITVQRFQATKMWNLQDEIWNNIPPQ